MNIRMPGWRRVIQGRFDARIFQGASKIKNFPPKTEKSNNMHKGRATAAICINIASPLEG